MKIKIIIAEDHPYIREGMIYKLKDHSKILIVEEAVNGEELFNKYIIEKPDVCLVEMFMEKMNGGDVVKKLAAHNYPIKALFISDTIDEYNVLETIRCNGKGLIGNFRSHDEIAFAIEEIAQGRLYYDRAIDECTLKSIEKKFNSFNNIKGAINFTKKEMEYLNLYGEGLTTEAISKKLFVSIETVNYHKKN